MNSAWQLRRRKIFLPPIVPTHPSQDRTAALSDGSAAPFPDSARHWNNSVVGLRKQTKGRIVNGWLVLIAFVGAVISVADGLTRAPNPGLELSPPQPLEYVPYHAAFLLAAVALPLMFAYAKKARASLSEAFFLWFVLCTAAYMKDFSYLRLPGTPLYVTDLVLIALLLWIRCAPYQRHSNRHVPLKIFLTLFIGAGVLAAVRGFLGHRELILVLRDSALIAYPLFLGIGYYLLESWLAIKRAAVWFVLGTTLSVLNGFGWLIVAPEQRRFVFPGIYILISLIGVFILTANRLIRPQLGWILAIGLSLGLLLANMRSLFVSLSVVSFLALVTPGLLRGKVRSVRLATALIGATALVCSGAFFLLHQQASRDFTSRVGDNLDSGLLHTTDDPYWQFRQAAWKEAWHRFEEYPPAGEGFGVPFNFEIWDNDPRPHNTYLTVLYKMGLLGFLPSLALLAYFFWHGLRVARANAESRRIPFLQTAILAQACFCVFGGANLLFESPYLASLFWAGMGVSLRMIDMFDFERSVRNIAIDNFVEHRTTMRFGKLPTQGAIR